MHVENSLEVENSVPGDQDFDKFLKQLDACTASTKRQLKTLQILLDSDVLFEKYLKHSGNCRELFDLLDETVEEVNELTRSNQPLNLNETNADLIFSCLDKACVHYQNKLKKLTDSSSLLLTDKTELKAKFNSLCTILIDKYIKLITRCLKMRSGTKKTIELQETCVRLLTVCLNQSIDFAKKIALEFDYFNDFKNWLERFLLLRQTNLREYCVQFLVSFLKYIQTSGSTEQSDDQLLISVDREYLVIIKKIFLNDNSAQQQQLLAKKSIQGKKKAKTDSTAAVPTSSLITCLFSHVGTDSIETIEFLLQELLFKLVQNESFNKSERIKFFNEKNLLNLVKLYEWRDKLKNTSNSNNDSQIAVHQMITEFLKVLFCSTRFGINFYDKTLNVDQSAKNFNHLIFSAMIAIQRQPNESRTNEMIDDLFLRTLKVCPDLIQRFLKVKVKQESSSGEEWFIRFTTRLFEQQLASIRSMKKCQISNTSYLRSLAVGSDDPATFLCDLIINTSLPLCLHIQKNLSQIFVSKQASAEMINSYNQSLALLISSLRCVKEWKECLRYFELNQTQFKTNSTDQTQNKIYEALKKIIKNENFNSKLNLELLTKHLPKFDTFCDSNLVKQILEDELNKESSMAIANSFEIFNLYFDIFMTRSQQINESDDLIGNCFNLLQIETLDQSLVKIIPALLSLSSDSLTTQSSQMSSSHLAVCLKYLKFLIKYSSLKQTESYLGSSVLEDSADSQLKIIPGKSYLINYKNLNVLNLIKIMFKFRDQSSFKLLIGYYLKIIGVYLEESQELFESSSMNSVYLWLLLVKKHFADYTASMKSNELNLFVDYIYLCLNQILNYKQRNLVLFQINSNKNNETSDDLICFNQIFVFICLKNYLMFANMISQNEMNSFEEALTRIDMFLNDYILSSGLMLENFKKNSLQNLFDIHLKNQLLLDENRVAIEALDKKLNLKLNEIINFKLKNKKTIEHCSESFMITFEETSNLINFKSDKSFCIIELNLNLRISHLLFLISLIVNKNEHFDLLDLDIVLVNLKNCLETKQQISTLDPSTVLKLTENEADKLSSVEELLELEEAILIEKINFNKYFEHIKSTLNDLVLDESSLIRSKINLALISEFSMEKQSFVEILEEFFNELDTVKLNLNSRFNYFAKVLIKNQNFLFESDIELFKEFDLDETFLDNLELLSKSTRILLFYLSNFDYNKYLDREISTHNELVEFLTRAFNYKPVLFKLLVKLTAKNDSVYKNWKRKRMEKFAGKNEQLIQILYSCFKEEEEEELQDENQSESEKNFLKIHSLSSSLKKEIKSLSKEKLLAAYTYSLSQKDQTILKRLRELDPDLNCLITETVKVYDFITLKLSADPTMITTSIFNYPIKRKLADMDNKLSYKFSLDSVILDEQFLLDVKLYDPIYVLPNLYHLLDPKNAVDVVQFVQSKCLSYLFASLSSECINLRSMSYACIYRFASHLEKNKSYFKNIIVHLISLLRNSIKIENLRLPTVISVFLAEAIMIVIEPGTNLYKPIISFLLLKPTIDLTNVPEFYKLFNSSSLQYKIERKWIMNILALSCRTSLDYRLYEKRFIFRQLMSIYSSKMSDLDTKLAILNLIHLTCQCKFALIDLIKRHYLLVWLSNILEECLNRSNQQTELNIFYKLIQIYILIWNQLGSNRIVKSEDDSTEQLLSPPLTFLNQMFILMKIFLAKLMVNHSKINELKFEYKSSETVPNSQSSSSSSSDSINLAKLVIRNFFKVKRELTESLQSHNLNLINFESSDNLDNELKNLWNKSSADLTFTDIIDKIERRKRACSTELNLNTKKTRIN